MLEILQYATSGLFVFIGHCVVIALTGSAIADIISAIRGNK